MGPMSWLVLAPLVAAALILIMPKLGGVAYRLLALIGSILGLVIAVSSWAHFNVYASGYQFVSRMTWFTLPNAWQGKDLTIGLSFGADGLSLVLVTLAGFVTTLAIFTARSSRERAKEYFFWLSLLTAALYAVFTALDMFTFMAALEVGLLSTFFLIYLFGDEGRQRAAFKFLIYRGLASVFLLTSFIGIAYFLGNNAGTAWANSSFGFGLPELQRFAYHGTSAAASAFFLLLLLGVFIEEAFVPVHTWLPTTHEHADTPTNMIVGGILTKTGAYVLFRFGLGLLPGELHRWAGLIAAFGVINILYGAFSAWAQKDWRRLIAFGSISHMGLVLLGIASINSAGLQGAMFMIVSSGLLNTLLFFTTGAMKDRTHSIQIPNLGGLSKSMPILSGFLLVAALGSLGLPLTSGFVSEIQAFIGGFGAFPVLSAFGALGVILSAVYLLYAMQKTTFGPTQPKYLELTDARTFEYVPLVALTALVLLVGIYPSVIGNLFGTSVHLLLGIGG